MLIFTPEIIILDDPKYVALNNSDYPTGYDIIIMETIESEQIQVDYSDGSIHRLYRLKDTGLVIWSEFDIGSEGDSYIFHLEKQYGSSNTGVWGLLETHSILYIYIPGIIILIAGFIIIYMDRKHQNKFISQPELSDSETPPDVPQNGVVDAPLKGGSS